MKRYELAVMRRAVARVIQKVGRRRVRVMADRVCADVALFTLLTDVRVAFVIRVTKSTKICLAGGWHKLDTLRFAGNTRRRALGRLLYCARYPQRCRLAVMLLRARLHVPMLLASLRTTCWTRLSHRHGPLPLPDRVGIPVHNTTEL
jgi:hypothetical protein